MTTDFDTALLNFTELVRRYRDTGLSADLTPVTTAIDAAIATAQRDLAEWYVSIASAGLGFTIRIAPECADRRPAAVQ